MQSYMTFPVEKDLKVVAPLEIFNELKYFYWEPRYKCFVHYIFESLIYPCDIVNGVVKIRNYKYQDRNIRPA